MSRSLTTGRLALCKPPSSFALARGSCSLTLPRTRRDLPIDHRIAEHHTDWMPGIVNASNASALGSPAQSVQILALVRQANVSGVPRYIGRVLNRWSNVHIADVAALDVLAAARAPAGSLVYVESGEEHSFKSSEQLRPGTVLGLHNPYQPKRRSRSRAGTCRYSPLAPMAAYAAEPRLISVGCPPIA